MNTNYPSLIIYLSDDETIVTTPSEEKATIKAFFVEGGRDIEDYDRSEHYGAASITPRLKVW